MMVLLESDARSLTLYQTISSAKISVSQASITDKDYCSSFSTFLQFMTR